MLLNRIFVKLGCACKGDKISPERVARNNAEKVSATLFASILFLYQSCPFISQNLFNKTRLCTCKYIDIHISSYICKTCFAPNKRETDKYMYISVYPLSLYIKKLGFISKKLMASLKSHRDFYLVTRHERTLTMMPVYAVRNMGMKTSLWHVYMKFAFIYLLLLQTLARLT